MKKTWYVKPAWIQRDFPVPCQTSANIIGKELSGKELMYYAMNCVVRLQASPVPLLPLLYKAYDNGQY